MKKAHIAAVVLASCMAGASWSGIYTDTKHFVGDTVHATGHVFESGVHMVGKGIVFIGDTGRKVMHGTTNAVARGIHRF